MRKLARIVAAVLGVVLATVAVLFFLNASPSQGAQGDRLFSITKGESLTRIAERLQSEGFIRFAPLLRLASILEGTQGSFKAGYYRIPPHASTAAIHRLLVSGSEMLERITVPEGWTVRKIAEMLEAKGVCPASQFIAVAGSPDFARELGIPAGSLEGYLFPDTYFLSKPFPAEPLARMMVKNFFSTLAVVAPQFSGMTAAALHDRVILASIVEREYRVAEEAPLIASVFENRLALNIGLESCATIEYIITEIQQKAHPEYITLEDERIDSPYNTYKWAGLPPGPISNPGRIALDAAFNTARTDYLYFVLKDADTGRHYFSRDLREHNQAKFLYLKK